MKRHHEGIHILLSCHLPSASYPDATGNLSVATIGKNAWGSVYLILQDHLVSNGMRPSNSWVKMTLQPTMNPTVVGWSLSGWDEGQWQNIDTLWAGHENVWSQNVLLLERKQPKAHVFVQYSLARSCTQRGWGWLGWRAINGTNFSIFLCQCCYSAWTLMIHKKVALLVWRQRVTGILIKQK